jgi:phosphoglycerate dehydrogenase-like enzyme
MVVVADVGERGPDDENSEGPTIVLAMMEGLVGSAFTEMQIDRLAGLGRLADRAPLTSFDDDRARQQLADAEVLVGHWGCPTLTPEVLALAPRLRLFAYAAGTVKWQVTDAVWDRHIVVTSAAAANAVPVAEFTVAMILLANKGVLLFREMLRAPGVKLPLDPSRIGNVGKRIGIVGASHVGRLTIELLRPYALDVLVYDPYLAADDAAALGVEKVDDLTELCGGVDVLSIHAPDIEATRGMIGAAQIAALRDGAVFINTARPALVDQDALLEHLESGRISAILDVTTPEPLPADHPLLALANVFVTPHIAGSMGTELSRMADYAIDEVARYAHGDPPRYPVTEADLDRIA